MYMTSNSTYVDIPGLLSIQKYLYNSPPLTSNTNIAQLGDIDDQIHKLSSALKKNDGSNIINQQKAMERIVDDESKRLDEKKKSVEIASTSQNRLILLNQNYDKRFYEYLKVAIGSLCGLAIIAVCIILGLPSTITTLVSIIVISCILIYFLYIYIKIQGRDNIHFDEINQNYLQSVDPSTATGVVTPNKVSPYGVLNNLNLCVGSDCCSNETLWNAETYKCDMKPVKKEVCPKVAEGFGASEFIGYKDFK
jgi:hypothetical protein